MTKRKLDKTSPAVSALLRLDVRAKSDVETSKLFEKEQSIIDTRAVIYSAIGNWIGEKIEEGGVIPIVRNGETVGTLPQTIFGDGPVEQVTAASKADYKTDLKNKAERIAKTAGDAEVLMNSLLEMTGQERTGLDFGPFEFFGNSYEPLEVRIIKEIGYVRSALIACSMIKSEAEVMQKSALAGLKGRETRPGRPRNEAAYAVALELARLYAKVTGRRPTYSEDPNGVSGEYTPALRDVFDSLGWSDITLSGPAEAAKKKITDEDLDHPRIGAHGIHLGLPKG